MQSNPHLLHNLGEGKMHGISGETENGGTIKIDLYLGLGTRSRGIRHGKSRYGKSGYGKLDTVNWSAVDWGTVNWGTVNWGMVNQGNTVLSI